VQDERRGGEGDARRCEHVDDGGYQLCVGRRRCRIGGGGRGDGQRREHGGEVGHGLKVPLEAELLRLLWISPRYEPTHDKRGAHAIRFTYDDSGKKTDEASFDARGRAVAVHAPPH